MAITHLGNIATGTENTSDSALAIANGTAASAGQILVLVVAIDNIGTTTATETNEVTGVTDNVGGNTWVKQAENRYSEGAAADGATCAIFLCRVTNTLNIG